MRVFHAAVLNRYSVGVVRQMQMEQLAAESLGLPWDVRAYLPSIPAIEHGKGDTVVLELRPNESKVRRSTLGGKARRWMSLRVDAYRRLKAESRDAEVILLRYSPHDPLLLVFMMTSTKPVFLVFHTKYTAELLTSHGFISRARALLNHLIEPVVVSKAAGSVCVTPEIAADLVRSQHRLRSSPFVYPNGFFFPSDLLQDGRSEQPSLGFIASEFDSWHGLDLLATSAAARNESFTLHVIGRVPDPLLALLRQDRRFVVHGQLSEREYRAILSRCWAGLSGFGMHRQSMTQASPLKVREYLAMGLPVVAGHEDIFAPSCEFFRQVRPDISEILDAALQMRAASRFAVQLAAEPWISKTHLLEGLHHQILKSVKNRNRLK